MRIFLEYLKYHRKQLFLFCLCAVIFAIVFYLYALPAEAVAYAVLLCAAVTLPCTVIGFSRFYRKHKLLLELQNRIAISAEDLPVPQNLLEEDYCSLLQILHSLIRRIDSQEAARHSEMLDYYTLWAHQIKTPIAAMQLLLQSKESETNEELQDQLFKIEQYVGMVLQYLRLESMSSDLVVKWYPLDTIVKQAIRKYAKSFIRKKVTLELSDINCEVLTDEKWLVFVLEQLISNALKYTNKGKISIYMEKDRSKTLVIQDTGIGIRADDLPRVFEKGFTGYNGRTDKKSTGIGLYLCKKILTKLSHTITIESKMEKGTKVCINLDSVDKISE